MPTTALPIDVNLFSGFEIDTADLGDAVIVSQVKMPGDAAASIALGGSHTPCGLVRVVQD